MVLEVGRDIMILKGLRRCIHSKTQVIVSKEWKAEEGESQGNRFRDGVGGAVEGDERRRAEGG